MSSYSLTKARVFQYVGILFALGLIAVGYWYWSARAGVKSNTAASQPQGVGQLDSGLAGYWKLDETTGSTATDASTNGNNGTLTNMENGDWTTGQIGNGLNFDGVDEYVSIPDANSLDITSKLTLSAWIRPDTTPAPGTYSAIMSKGNSSPAVNYALEAYSTGGSQRISFFFYNGGSHIIRGGTELTTGVWYHLTATYDDDANDIRLYVNGVPETEIVEAGAPESNSLIANGINFEMGRYSGGHYFDGRIDEVRVYNRALSGDEIGNLYRLTSPTSVDTSLKGYWSFDGQDISGTTAYDRSGAGNNGTLMSGPAINRGVVGQALSFSGSNYVTVPDSTALNPMAQVTLDAWVKRTSIGTRQFFVSKGNATSVVATQYWLEFTAGNAIVFELANGSTEHKLTSNTILTDTSVWHHIVGTYDGTTQKIYVDGVQDSATLTWSGALNTTGNDLALGNRSTFYDIGFYGHLDEVRVYSRALTASEIKSLYDISAPDKTNSSSSQAQGTGRLDGSLAGYWKLDETTGSTATDASTNGNNGTLTNMENGDWATGQIGNGLTFDGVNEYVSASATPFASHASGTITAWIKSTNSSALQSIFGVGTMASFNYGGYFGTNANGKLQIRIKGNGSDLINCQVSDSGASAQVADSGTWTFVAITNDATGKKFYKNAYQQGNDCGSDTTWLSALSAQPPVDASIGSWLVGGGAGVLFSGSIDEVRVYDRAFSADEIGELYRVTTPTAVDTSLKGYWSFNGQDMNATSAYDRSGIGNTGTLSGGPAVTKGIIGQALSFDGTNDIVTVTCPSTLSNATISFWAKTNGLGGTGNKHPIDIRDNSGNSVIAFRSGAADDIFIRNAGGTTAQITTLDYSLDNSWHQYVATTDGTNLVGYKDGISVGSVAWPSSLTSIDNCFVGSSSGDDFFAGSVDEVRIYNRALTASEIQGQYNVVKPDKVNSSATQSQGTGRLDSGLAGYWPLDNGSGSSATDLSTNGNTGTLTNGPTWATGQVGSAVQFDGVDDHLSFTQETRNRGSVSLWAKPSFSLDPSDTYDLYSAEISGSYFHISFNTFDVSNAWEFSYRGSYGNDVGLRAPAYTSDPQLQSWHHIVAVWDVASGASLYVDGTLVATTSTTTNSFASFTSYTLAKPISTDEYYAGFLDEVRAYDRILSADEVSQLYRIGTPTSTDTSLKGYWSFNGQDMNGTTAFDRSGSANNGTLTGGPTVARGKLGQALNFVAASETFVDVPNTTSIDLVGTMTVSMWVKLGTTNGSNQRLLTKGTSDGYHLYWLSGGELAFGNSTGFKKTVATYSAADGWIHVTATYDNSGTFAGYLLYINGQLVTSTATAGSFTAFASGGTLGIGGRGGWPGTNGSIDEVRIYNRALTAAEVLGLYNQSK